MPLSLRARLAVQCSVLAVLAIESFSAGSVAGQQLVPANQLTTANIESVAQITLDASIASSLVPGATAGIQLSNGTTWNLATGYTDTSRATTLMPNTEMRIGSQTKTYTGTIILQLVQQNVVSLDQTLAYWANAYPSTLGYLNSVPNANSITIRDLLDMRSGIPDYLNAPPVAATLPPGATFPNILEQWATFPTTTVYTPQQLITATNGMARTTPAPGNQMSYTNTNFVILGAIAQQATGQSIESLITNNIINQLNLTSTSFPTTTAYPPNANYSKGTAYLVGTQPLDFTFVNPSVPWAAGAMISTTSDELVWIRQLTQNSYGLLSSSVQADRLASLLPDSTVAFYPASYGLGFYSQPSSLNGAVFLGHAGDIAGYTSAAFEDTGSGIGFGVNVNAAPTPDNTNAVTVMWLLDQNITNALSAAMSSSGTCSGTAQSAAPASCAGASIRLAPLTLGGAGLTIAPSGSVFNGYTNPVPDGTGGTIVTPTVTPVPTISFYGHNMAGMAMTGNATLTVQSGASLSMLGNNSSTVSLSGNNNKLVVQGVLSSLGSGTPAILDMGSGSDITLAPGSAVNAQTGMVTNVSSCPTLGTGSGAPSRCAAILLAGEHTRLTISGSVQNQNPFSVVKDVSPGLPYPALIDQSRDSNIAVTSTGAVTGAIDLTQSDSLLRVDGTVTGDVTLGSHALLYGSGSISGAVQGGVIASGDPGGAQGLTVGSLGGASALLVDLYGANSPLMVAGTADLSNVQVLLSGAPGSGDSIRTVIKAATISGQLASISSFGRIATTADYNNGNVRVASVSPVLMDAHGFLAGQSMLTQFDILRTHLRTARYDIAENSSSETRLASLDTLADAAPNMFPAGSKTVAGPNGNIWMRGIYEGGHTNSLDGVSAFDASGGGLLIGAERYFLPGIIAGISFGYDSVNAEPAGAPDRIALSGYEGSVYGSWTDDFLLIDGALQYGVGHGTQTRSTLNDGSSLSAHAAPDDGRFGAQIDVGATVPMIGANIFPNAGLSWLSVDEHRTSDTGAGAYDLSVGARTVQLLRVQAGADFDVPLAGIGMPGFGFLRIDYTYDSTTGDKAAAAQFAGFGAPFLLSGDTRNSNGVLFGVGARIDVRSNLSLNLDFEDNVTENYSAYWFSGGVRYVF